MKNSKQVKLITNGKITDLVCAGCHNETVIQNIKFNNNGFGYCQECRQDRAEGKGAFRVSLPAQSNQLRLGVV